MRRVFCAVAGVCGVLVMVDEGERRRVVESVGGLDHFLADDGVGTVGADGAAESVDLLLLDRGSDGVVAGGVWRLVVIDDERVGDVVLRLHGACARGGGGEFLLLRALRQVLLEDGARDLLILHVAEGVVGLNGGVDASVRGVDVAGDRPGARGGHVDGPGDGAVGCGVEALFDPGRGSRGEGVGEQTPGGDGACRAGVEEQG